MPGIDSDTKLMLHCNGTDGSPLFPDSSQSAHTVTAVATAQIDTAQSVFGGASGLFDGNSDLLTIPDSTDWDIFATTTEDWTIDLRARHDVLTGEQGYIDQYADANNYWTFRSILSGDFLVNFNLRVGGTHVINLFNVTTGKITDTNFHHVAVVKKGNEYGLYLDGIQIAYVLDSTTTTFASGVEVGRTRNLSYMDGHIDELRVQKSNYFNASPNVGLTDTITVPTAEYDAGTPPGVPTSLVATTFDDDRIDLSWVVPGTPGSSPIIGYKIERESPIGGGWATLVADTGNTNVTYSDSGLFGGTQYNYRVSAINSELTGIPSNESDDTTDNGEPEVPTSLVASRINVGQIDIDWTAPLSDGGSPITGYKIERESPIGGGWSVLVADTGNTNVAYSNVELIYDTEYNYRVSAINALGTSLASNEADSNTRDLNTNLLLHFTGDNLDTTTVDSSGNSHPITIASPAYINVAPGFAKYDLSALFIPTLSGLGDVSFPDDGTMPGGTSDYTIEFWIRFTDPTGAFGRYLYYQNDGDGNVISIKHILNHFTLTEGATSFNMPTFGFSSFTLYHIVIVKNGTNRKLYINGAQWSSTTFPLDSSNPTSTIYIGNNGTSSSLRAHYDEVRISNVARYPGTAFNQPRAWYTLGSPSLLVATNGATGINLNWTKPDNDGGTIVGYKIERESPIGGGFTTLIENTGSALPSYLDNTTTVGIQYNYRVSSVNIHGSGLASNEANETYFPVSTADDIKFNKFTRKHEFVDPTKDWTLDRFTGKHYKNYYL